MISITLTCWLKLCCNALFSITEGYCIFVPSVELAEKGMQSASCLFNSMGVYGIEEKRTGFLEGTIVTKFKANTLNAGTLYLLGQ